MMKVAASDYDGTLFRQDRIAKSDAEAIKKWREAEHKFGVVSGRDHGMLVPQAAATIISPATTAASSARPTARCSGRQRLPRRCWSR